MNTVHRSITLAAALCAAVAGLARAQGTGTPGEILPTPEEPPTRQGTRGANFLQIGVGARLSAMAGAGVTMVDGGDAWYWNPANAAGIDRFSANVTRHELYSDLDIAMNYGGIALPALGGVVGASVTSLNSGDIDRSTENAPYGDPIVGETFQFTATAASLNYARRLTDRLDVGGGVKYITEGLTDARTNWVAFDFGTQFRTGIYGLTLAAALQNIGPNAEAHGELIRRNVNNDEVFGENTPVQFQVEETDLPINFRFSLGSELLGSPAAILGTGGNKHRLNAEAAFSDAIDTDLQFALGAEYSFANVAFIRGGKRFYNDDRAQGENKGAYGLSGGLGLRLPVGGRGLRFDYAYTNVGELENVQVFSFELGR